MPQTISLIEHFSIKEIIYYFGNLFEMNKDKIESRFQILKKVLELPMEDKWIGQLSGN
jgi:ABC-type Na+ transport system ATPase subunit NatA